MINLKRFLIHIFFISSSINLIIFTYDISIYDKIKRPQFEIGNFKSVVPLEIKNFKGHNESHSLVFCKQKRPGRELNPSRRLDRPKC